MVYVYIYIYICFDKGILGRQTMRKHTSYEEIFLGGNFSCPPKLRYFPTRKLRMK